MKVFISHSSIDKPFVRKLKRDLDLNYIKTWFDEDELQYGDSLVGKLSSELFNSSHFLIVLSPNSVNSDWVKFELENALKFLEVETIQKIIPVHYRDCPIPEEIENLLNIDLRKETVYIRNGEFELYGETYYNALDKLARSLQSNRFVLSEQDKNAILGKNALSQQESGSLNFHFKVNGFKSISNFLVNQVPEKERSNYSESLSAFVPVILPKQLEPIFPNIKFGDKITFQNQAGHTRIGNFAKFTANSYLSIPKSIRTFFEINKVDVFKVKIAKSTKHVTIELADDK